MCILFKAKVKEIGRLKGRVKEVEEKCNSVLINLDSQDLSNTGPPNRQHTPADMRHPTHIQ